MCQDQEEQATGVCRRYLFSAGGTGSGIVGGWRVEEIMRVLGLGTEANGRTSCAKVYCVDGDEANNVKLRRAKIGNNDRGVCMRDLADDGAV